MRATGRSRFLRREGDPHPVLQQEIICFENEVWENEVLVKADGEYESGWFDVPTFIEVLEYRAGAPKITLIEVKD